MTLVASNSAPMLQVENLRTHFRSRAGLVKAVDGVSFTIDAGSSLGIVGESGSGKSVTSLSIMGLIEPPGFVAGGQIRFKGRDLARMSERELQTLRGRDICLVFQDSMSALNPVYTVGAQIVEAIRAHQALNRAAAMKRAIELLRLVGISAPERRVNEFPHRLSGGMQQRITIAMALANEPQLLILDEPTTALDATIQAQILELIKELRQRASAAVLLITHDIGVVREMCETVVVMYGGRVMESGSTAEVTDDPLHPYTAGLLASIPQPERRGSRLPAIGGTVPNPLSMPPGCPFQPRCTKAMDVCTTMPEARSLSHGRQVACWLY